jgi:hypothetical protein
MSGAIGKLRAWASAGTGISDSAGGVGGSPTYASTGVWGRQPKPSCIEV